MNEVIVDGIIYRRVASTVVANPAVMLKDEDNCRACEGDASHLCTLGSRWFPGSPPTDRPYPWI